MILPYFFSGDSRFQADHLLREIDQNQSGHVFSFSASAAIGGEIPADAVQFVVGVLVADVDRGFNLGAESAIGHCFLSVLGDTQWGLWCV